MAALAVLDYADTFGALKKHVDEEDKQNCQNDSVESNRCTVGNSTQYQNGIELGK